MELKNKTVSILGDSITEGYGASSTEQRYADVLKRKYELAEVKNYGVAGTRYARQIKPSEWPQADLDFPMRLEEMDGEPDIVVVFGGTNDYGHGDAPIGTFEDREPSTFYGACHRIYSRLIEKFPKAVIVVMTPCHRLNEERTNGDNADKAYHYGSLSDYVSIIREVAEYYSLPVCDVYKNYGVQPSIPIMKQMYMPDGLHPNDAGHERLAALLGNFLLTL